MWYWGTGGNPGGDEGLPEGVERGGEEAEGDLELAGEELLEDGVPASEPPKPL